MQIFVIALTVILLVVLLPMMLIFVATPKSRGDWIIVAVVIVAMLIWLPLQIWFLFGFKKAQAFLVEAGELRAAAIAASLNHV